MASFIEIAECSQFVTNLIRKFGTWPAKYKIREPVWWKLSLIYVKYIERAGYSVQ